MTLTPARFLGRSSLRPLLALTLLVGACQATPRSTPPGEGPKRDAIALTERLTDHPDDVQAEFHLALLEWIYLGEIDQATVRLERLAGQGLPQAQLARLLMTEARMDALGIRQHAYAIVDGLTQAPAKAPDRAIREVAAEQAVQVLSDVHGDRPGDDERFIDAYERWTEHDLPYSVAQPLHSLRASIARRFGEDVEPYFAQEGCVQSWQVGPVEGTLGAEELRLPKRIVPPGEAEGAVVPLSCVTRLWNPTPRAGIRAMATWLEVPGSTLVLDIGTKEPAVVRVDGVQVFATDITHRYPLDRARLALNLEPGAHHLEIDATVSGERAWVLARAVDGQGEPVRASASPRKVAAPFNGSASIVRERLELPALPQLDYVTRPLDDLVNARASLHIGDADRVESMVAGFELVPQFAEGQLMRARFERADPSRTRTISAVREQRALEAALAVDPKLDAARLRLLDIMMGRGESTEVVQALGRLDADRLRSLDAELFRFAAQRAQGNEHLALAALGRAEAIDPQNCRVLMAKRTLARERDAVRLEDALTKDLETCAGSLPIRARLAETRGEHDQARALWSEALARVPDEIDALEGLARLSAGQGDRTAAASYLEQILAFNPLRVGMQIGLADLEAMAGKADAARGRLAQALGELPHSDGLRQAAAALGVPDDLMAFRVDGLEALQAYRDSGVTYEGVSEVLVLDRSVARVYENGGQRQIVHLVVHLLSKEALDEYGEITVSPSARLLTLRSIKPDGTILEPEVVEGKDGVELRHLEIGDVVDYEFLVEEAPKGALPNYVDVTTFRFQSLDIPYHRSELMVVFPEGTPMKVDRRNNPPVAEMTKRTVGDQTLDVWHFRADEVPRLGVEPGHRSLLEELPNVRVFTDLDVSRWLRTVAAGVRGAERTNPELRTLARRLVRGRRDPATRLRALWSWVVENVEEGGDISTPATATLAGRRGNRLMLLRAMANTVSLPSELWLVRDKFGPKPLPGGHPMVDAYDTALLAFDVGQPEPIPVMTVSKVMPVGYLPPAFSETTAYRVPLEADHVPEQVTLPARAPSLVDRRDWDLVMSIDGKGDGRVSGELTLRGMEAAKWRQALREVDRDRLSEVFLGMELGWLRGATLERLDVRHEDDLDAALVLEFEATAAGIGLVQGGTLLLRSAPIPLNMASSYTSLPSRNTGLVIPYAPVQDITMTLELVGATPTDLPSDTAFEGPFGRFQRDVEVMGRQITLRYHHELHTGVVEATEYPDLAGFARRIETALRTPIRAKPDAG